MADYYAELGVAREANEEEIKRAYRRLAMRYHPDRHPNDMQAEDRFKRINRAHQVLSDKRQRALYDRFGEPGLGGTDFRGYSPHGNHASYPGGAGKRGAPFNLEDLFGATGFTGFSDLFGDVFTNRKGSRRAGASGSARSNATQNSNTAQNSNPGRANGAAGSGRSARQANDPSAKGNDSTAQVEIELSSAIRGLTVQVHLPGRSQPTSVRIPPGVGDGDKVRVAGCGAPAPAGGPAGDLLLTVQVTPHPVFRRDGLDLHVELPIAISEAYFGAKVELPTPGGSVLVAVPPSTQSGQVARLRGCGVRRQERVGDLYVKYLVRLPEQRSKVLDDSVAAIRELEAGSELRRHIVL